MCSEINQITSNRLHWKIFNQMRNLDKHVGGTGGH